MAAPEPFDLDLLFYRTDTPLGRVIRLATRGRYDHVTLAHGTLQVEATADGVVVTDRFGGEYVKAARHLTHDLTPADAKRAWDWACAQAGTPYDWSGAAFAGLRVLTRIPVAANAPAAYYCSELVATALFVAGMPLRCGIVAVTPQQIADETLGDDTRAIKRYHVRRFGEAGSRYRGMYGGPLRGDPCPGR